MKVYFDTSALIKLYYPEPESEKLSKWIFDSGISISISPFHAVEFSNAFALKYFRNEIAEVQFNMVMDCLEQDKEAGVLIESVPNFSQVLSFAARLSRQYTRSIGCRSLDIIHVASALVGEYRRLLSYDNRQKELAAANGLEVISIE